MRKMKPPVIQGEMVSDLLHPLDIHKTVGLNVIHLRILRELIEELNEHFQFFTSSPG